ncbi:unnamed protein product, partial [Musa acuminata subsp. malaccensis]
SLSLSCEGDSSLRHNQRFRSRHLQRYPVAIGLSSHEPLCEREERRRRLGSGAPPHPPEMMRPSMKHRRRAGGGRSWARGSSASPSWFLLFAFLCCALFAAVAFSTFRIFGVSFRPVLMLPTWQNSAINAMATDHPFFTFAATKNRSDNPPSVRIEEVISFPDQVLLFLQFPGSLPRSDLACLYYPPSNPTTTISSSSSSSSSSPVAQFHLPATIPSPLPSFVRCPLAPRFNLRPARLADPSRYECVYGWNFAKPNYFMTSPVLTAAQEIIRCPTPHSILLRLRSHAVLNPPLVSVKTKGRGAVTLPSVAHHEILSPSRRQGRHTMCVCTMVRNQARFLPEWIIYHSRLGVERWFIYDNDSDDDTEQVLESMDASSDYNVTRHLWPWVKTQEAGFAHCALRARGHCRWVGFIDVDEFLYLPTNVTLHDVLRNYSRKPRIGELRIACHSFGPSGRRTVPSEGVMAGYTCRLSAPERHKSIVRPEVLNPSLINVVHHFHLKDGMRYVNMEKGLIVINHYKYQVWQVFKEKFYRRVATYVVDWQIEENVGSKDRAPGLGTKAVEPSDWPSRFCEVHDTGLKDWVSVAFANPRTGLLPW